MGGGICAVFEGGRRHSCFSARDSVSKERETIFLHKRDAWEMMRVYGHDDKEQINATLLNVAADGPARLKFSGFVSSNSEENMCTVCDKPLVIGCRLGQELPNILAAS